MNEPLPTPRELAALKIIWEHSEVTVRDIYRGLQSEQSDLAYTTVLSLVQTMEKKGLVRRDGHGRGLKHSYRALVEPDHTFRSLAGEFLDRVFDGAVGQYLVSALESRRPDEEQLRELQGMINEAKKRLRKK